MKNTTFKISTVLLALAVLLSTLVGCGVAGNGNVMSARIEAGHNAVVRPQTAEKETAANMGEADTATNPNAVRSSMQQSENACPDTEIQVGNQDQQQSNAARPQDEIANVANTKVGNPDAQTASQVEQSLLTEPKGDYQAGVVLVKYEEKSALTADTFGEVEIASFEPLYRGSDWYKVFLKKASETVNAIKTLASLGTFAAVDYDYIMNGDAEIDSIDISGNDYEPNPGYFKPMEVQDGWKSLTKDGKEAGGSSDVIVAVIDTGVDYNHVDLRNNIWHNPGEIPDNGIDDDGNGYVDDVYGWNCVGDNNNPMDDNGHGTHVAGIVAAENNKIGTVGIAYNCKVMCLKAGTSSGSFTNSDIAEAVRYAYMNGASVINMSFGGTSISLAVEEALEDAYNQCVLVAAAGNDGMCNQPGCPDHEPTVEVCYPAALNYVIGVMSCNADGTAQSDFSNFDHYQYNTYEYDVYAPGEQIASTFPNNNYAKLSGTSMASPAVAGIAALVRSYFSDREQYSTKFITAQIVRGGDSYICASVYDAINVLPTPNIYGIYDYYIFDDPKFSANNNGNGIIEAGEVIHLGFELMNRGGKATDVTVSVNTKRLAEDITDPYIHILSNDITYDEIGTYSIRDGGKVYDDSGKVVDVAHPIILKIDEATPNDYLSKINFVYTYKNGLNSKDTATYSGEGSVSLTVTNGYILPYTISEDTVFTADRRYIVAHDVTIPKGVTVTFKEGCDVQFYADSYGTVADGYYNSPIVNVYGALYFTGTKDAFINIHPAESYWDYAVFIFARDEAATLQFDYCNTTNLSGRQSSVGGIGGVAVLHHCIVSYDHKSGDCVYRFESGRLTSASPELRLAEADSCYFNLKQNRYVCLRGDILTNSCIIFGNGMNSELGGGGSIPSCNNLVVFDADTKNKGGSNGWSVVNTTNTSVVTNYYVDSVAQLPPMSIGSGSFSGNVFAANIIDYIPQIAKGYIQADGTPALDLCDLENHDDSVIWPYIKNIELSNEDGEAIRTVGSGKATVKVTFNRPMNTSKDFTLYYGSVAPYTDYAIHGDFADDGMSWTGEFQVKAMIEGGRNFFSAGDGCAADDSFKTLVNNAPSFAFDIDTTQAMSMNLQGVSTADGIALTWVQDDYDTLMGYNVYRSTQKDGNYVKLNTSVIPTGENTFLDENAEPGQTYWYTFTVVLSDMSESQPAGKISCTAKDTLAPHAYHTPVNQGYLNNNLVISCTANDNVAVSEVKLYYRTVGETAWKTLVMSKQNDRFSATIFGSELSLDGLEYYITVSDGVSIIQKGSADNPYTVIIKDASSIAMLGDVDGDGVITTKDAVMMVQTISKDLILTDDQFKRADLNKDGVLSSKEALRILQYIDGNVKTLEM